MNAPVTVTVPPASLPEPTLDYERLDAYVRALEFHALACTLIPRRGFRTLRDQLERASLGVVLCIAEGAGRTSSPAKKNFYEMARGSATESGAVLDVLRVRGLLDLRTYQQARTLLIRVVQMLSRLCAPPR